MSYIFENGHECLGGVDYTKFEIRYKIKDWMVFLKNYIS